MKKQKFSKVSLFLFKALICSIILLLVVIFENKIDFSKFHESINFNKITVKLLRTFDSTFQDEIVSSNYIESEYINNTNIVNNVIDNQVLNLNKGTVIKISKHDNLYDIVVQSIDDYYYKYINLIDINCYLYQYLDNKAVIGMCSNNTYNLQITKDGTYYQY